MTDPKDQLSAFTQPLSRDASSLDANPAPLRFLYSRLPFLLKRSDQIVHALHATIDTAGVTLPQAELLWLLAGCAPCSQIELAREGGFDKSTAALIVANLVAAGWCSRSQDGSDRRRKLIALQPAGQDLIGTLAAQFSDLQQQLTAELGSDQRHRLARLLSRLAAFETQAAPPWLPRREPAAAAWHSQRLFALPSFLIRRSLQIADGLMQRRCAPWGITAAQYAALFIVDQYPGITQIGVARALGWDASTTALVLGKLSRRELLVSRRCEADRRQKRFDLTMPAHTVLSGVTPQVASLESELHLLFTSAELDFIIHCLNNVMTTHNEVVQVPLTYFGGNLMG